MIRPNRLDLDVTQARLSGQKVKRTGKCVRCGSPTLRHRLTCSDVCRTRSRHMGEAGKVRIDGVIDRPLALARERGVDKGTFYKRIRLGWSIKDAITKPVRAKLG